MTLKPKKKLRLRLRTSWQLLRDVARSWYLTLKRESSTTTRRYSFASSLNLRKEMLPNTWPSLQKPIRDVKS
jgi:hypothetical protein